MTHYATLGVTETASPEEIKRAYRKLASQHHPDKGGDTAMFQRVEEAYRVLSDPNQRQQYDIERQGGGRSFRFNMNGNDIDINDVFSQFGFGTRDPFTQFRARTERKNKDLRITINVELVSTLSDQKKTVSIQTTNGQRETVEVTIPRGISHGSTIKYVGLGDNFFNTLPRGDLYVVINTLPHPRFRAHDLDLLTRVEINCFDAITGGETEIVGLDNRTFVITIPPGTQHGTKLRIKGQGLFLPNQPVQGNLIIELHITIPNNLTEEQIILVKQLQSNL
jgi:curved DNA-binding protein